MHPCSILSPLCGILVGLLLDDGLTNVSGCGSLYSLLQSLANALVHVHGGYAQILLHKC